METYYVYILQCVDDSYYTGITNNIEMRLSQHQEGVNPQSYTFSRRPVELVFCEGYNDPNEAISFERKIKTWSEKQKEALIKSNLDQPNELSCF